MAARFSIDAAVHIQGDDRAGIERLLRYCARLLYRFPRPTPDGRTEILLSPLQLLERIARFVPPPRMHRHRYHGVLAPNARARSAVIAIGRRHTDPSPPVHTTPSPPPAVQPDPEPARPASSARIRWAVLLARIYDVLPLLCPACRGQMSILAFLTAPPVVSAILLHLDPGPPRNARCVG